MISFMFRGKRRTQLFLKFPHGSPAPSGNWECVCGQVNSFNCSPEAYCSKCGTKLRVEENRDERQKMLTLVRVGHIETSAMNGDGSEEKA